MSIASTGVINNFNEIAQLAENDNVLTTVTIIGSEVFQLGFDSHKSNSGDGVVTDIAATATSPTTIHSSLTLIDASATTGGVGIFAGATNTSADGSFDNGGSLNSNITITYTGLTIEGGSGNNDFIENDAKNGIVTDGNGNDDEVILGGGGAKAALGNGTGDMVVVGVSGSETMGNALGDSVKFGSAATAALVINSGAEAGSTAGTAHVGLTKVLNATDGMKIDFAVITKSNTIADETAAVASATTLTAAENAAVAALSSPGVAFFNYKGSEYFIAATNTETAISSQDAIVKLVGVVDLHATNSLGVVTLHV